MGGTCDHIKVLGLLIKVNIKSEGIWHCYAGENTGTMVYDYRNVSSGFRLGGGEP